MSYMRPLFFVDDTAGDVKDDDADNDDGEDDENRSNDDILGASISMLNVLKISLMQLDIIFLKDFNSQLSTK